MSDNSFIIPPDLRDLVDQGDGLAEIVDPETKRVYLVTEQRALHPCGLPDTEEEIGRRLDEARSDIAEGRASTRTTDEFLAQRADRHDES